jgi:hypothetical protein
MPTTRRRKISLLGSLSLIAGIIALLATRMSLAGVGPITIGVVGTAIGLLGLLSAVVIGHAGRVLPVFAVLLCLAAAGYGYWANGRDDGIGEHVLKWINQPHTYGSQPSASSGHGANNSGGASSSPGSRSENGGGNGQSVGHGSIFDMNAPGTPEAPSHANPSPGPTAAGNSRASPNVLKPAGVDPTLLTRLASAQAAMRAAKAKLETAQKALVTSLTNQAAYQSAKAEVDGAEANLSSVRASSEPGSEAIVAASTRALSARIALQKIINTASASDPATSAAQREFTDAQRALVSIKAEQEAAAGRKP